MHTVNFYEAKTHFSKLVKAVNRGEEIMIVRAGKPDAILVLINHKITRMPDAFKGRIHRLPTSSCRGSALNGRYRPQRS